MNQDKQIDRKNVIDYIFDDLYAALQIGKTNSDIVLALLLDEVKQTIQRLLIEAREEELQAIVDYSPVSTNFDYRKYAQHRIDRIAHLTEQLENDK